MGALDGRVAASSPAPGRGIGREHALLFASEGAQGRRQRPRRRRRRDGRRRAAARSRWSTRSRPPAARRSPTPTTSPTWDGAEALIDQAVDSVRAARRARQQRRHPARRVHPPDDRGASGTSSSTSTSRATSACCATPPTTGASARKAGEEVKAAVINTASALGHVPAEPGPGQLRRRQGGDRGDDAGRRRQELGRYGVRVNAHRPGRAHAADRGRARSDRRRCWPSPRTRTRSTPFDPKHVSPLVAYLATRGLHRSPARCSPSRAA